MIQFICKFYFKSFITILFALIYFRAPRELPLNANFLMLNSISFTLTPFMASPDITSLTYRTIKCSILVIRLLFFLVILTRLRLKREKLTILSFLLKYLTINIKI